MNIKFVCISYYIRTYVSVNNKPPFMWCYVVFITTICIDWLLHARKFPWYVNFADFTVTYWYSENLICENLLVCNNYRFVAVHKMLPFHNEPVIRKNIIAKILFTSCLAKISCHKNFHVYGSLTYVRMYYSAWFLEIGFG